jgi:hypothetical protein
MPFRGEPIPEETCPPANPVALPACCCCARKTAELMLTPRAETESKGNVCMLDAMYCTSAIRRVR